jgi:cobalt-zinc-cadmium efflux system membrane fusion protein
MKPCVLRINAALPMKSPRLRIVVGLLAAVPLILGAYAAWGGGSEGLAGRLLSRLSGVHPAGEVDSSPTSGHKVEIVSGRPHTIRFSDEAFRTLGIHTAPVTAAPRPDPLRLAGSLVLDPNTLVRVHSRFTGELVHIGTTGSNGTTRSLRYGDNVRRGDLVAVVWSKEIGEKKSELVDAISKFDADQKLLQRLEATQPGVVAEKMKIDARRTVQADQIALARAERTLRSWHIPDEEIIAIQKEADEISRGQPNTDNDKSWAELEIRAPIDGQIVEKNFNEGAMVDPDDDLFQIANITQLLVLANVYEEDLPALRKLPPHERKWKVDLKADPHDRPLDGTFDLIGAIIDPEQHTGVVMGWVDNEKANLAAGQFITATVELPADADLVGVPASALVEEGGTSYVFVASDAGGREFERRKIDVRRRGRRTVFVADESATDLASGCEPLRVGEHVITTGVLELSAELDSAKSREPAQES